MATSERKCYWCGPLAEQVHRSRRAPPCDAPDGHVTTCEPGLMHCAVVATSPPHVESRFCVKLYQDECYPLFCNSTKTWKMTCPCRGDLCNGINSERETQAFAVLSKLVAKTNNVRIKRAISTSSSKQELTTIVTNMTALQLNKKRDGEIMEISSENEKYIVVTATARDDSVKENLSTENPTTPTSEQNENTDNSINDITTLENSNVSKLKELAVTQKTYNVSNEEIETNIPMTTMATRINVIKESLEQNTNVKPSEQLPSAEALQQNVTPSATISKITESDRINSTGLSTPEPEGNTTAQPTKEGGNYSGRLSVNINMFLFALLLIKYNC